MNETQDALVERIVREFMNPGSVNGSSTITINAGGVGVWIAAALCLMMFGMVLVGGFWMSREFNRIDARFGEQVDTDSVQDAYIHKLRAEQQKEKP